MSKKIHVAIQGDLGCYHHEALLAVAQKYNDLDGQVEPVPCTTSSNVVDALVDGRVDLAILAIENPIYGPTNQTYRLLMLNEKVEVIGEHFLPIDHCVIASTPDVDMARVNTVVSQREALGQCAGFIKRHNLGVKEFHDTAAAAKMVVGQGLTDTVAIASSTAAKLYGGHIVDCGVQDLQSNYTRFLLLARRGQHQLPASDRRKTTIWFVVNEQPGSLVAALQALAERGLNMSRIESRATGDQFGRYGFFVDIDHDQNDASVADALAVIKEQSVQFRRIGTYNKHQFDVAS